jgi:hypothetical protein
MRSNKIEASLPSLWKLKLDLRRAITKAQLLRNSTYRETWQEQEVTSKIAYGEAAWQRLDRVAMTLATKSLVDWCEIWASPHTLH